MRKQISVTNKTVIEIFAKQKNVSKYIQEAVLAYENIKNNDYITRQEVLELLAEYEPQAAAPAKNKVSKKDLKCILDL